ncbi:MAG: hypothetical protein A2806_02385 [Candidatus Terrybacteria bacterium RIFCSPHIGHO2_01_FULL_48_17]|uniref:beta-fructofuranosidase n=1 Tax=Candidatus Terrybacteria bacterium RIFCSPHIGHO2_01_FULL_48_17 TaxID=1802362 RepID=A0A1G2PHP2_9BACT|nr:MAG: hypothetical protein A2806_02385 [Candidatus Terrybacteria bacterium RIFCSPHIGHO2_01_FULL_48_17]OHA53590.1 MAG: hypothetical protein A3A30_00340 [Candidatus Terrybacteria bacterium RIFCSPLOWO2_01_FULL_48_14]
MASRPLISNALFGRAQQEARNTIHACVHRLGFKASAHAVLGYPHVWARDSMITSLGALASQDPVLISSVEASLETLAKHQTALGAIPTNVDTRSQKPEPHNQTQVDSSPWYIIGLEAFVRSQKPGLLFIRRRFSHVEGALGWLFFQDQNNDGLLEIQEAWDWEDLFAVRGTGLYINVLWHEALKKGAALASKVGKETLARAWRREAVFVKERINARLWDAFPPAESPKKGEWSFARMRKGRRGPFYFPYYTFWRFGRWCDALGNLLAILCGVASASQTRIILDYMARAGIAHPYPTKAITPSITPHNSDWRNYYRKYRLNLPNQYHNGGIWPFIGGLHVAALVKAGRQKKAEALLVKLMQANQKGKKSKWEFNEWLHGKTGRPLGMAKQAWSAGMFLYALEAVRRKNNLFF